MCVCVCVCNISVYVSDRKCLQQKKIHLINIKLMLKLILLNNHLHF